MASKQLGKLRQWAGEVISTREKTQSSSEFMALEEDIENRKKGLDKLYTASRDYLDYISLKKPSEAVPGEPIMQSEALGVVMIGHGDELGDASALGRSLAIFGRARCRIAAMQNIYAVTLTDTFHASLERSRSELDEYAAQRKKLESRRLALDAAIAKADKSYKKEKDKKDAEDELAKAKSRYEEMEEDVRTRMDAIREGEVDHQRELRGFLRSEVKFVEQYLQVLKEVEEEWPEPDSYADLRRPPSSFSTDRFSRTSTRSTESKDSVAKQASPAVPSRLGSHRSNHSIRSANSKKSISAASPLQHESSSESEDEVPRAGASSRASRRVSIRGSRTPSRQSKARSRSGSVTTIGNASVPGDSADDTTSVKGNGKHKKASSGVASWVGDAVSSVMSRNKSRNPDVDNFATLMDKDDGDEAKKAGVMPSHKRTLSNHSTRSNRSTNGRSRSQTRENGRNAKKVMKAVYDFSGSSDELSFKAGEEIVVVNEVLDDWWVGETKGRRGLFPTNYTVFLKMVVAPSTPSMKFKNASNSSILGLGRGKLSSEDEESRRTLVEPSESELSATEDERDEESIREQHPFDDSHVDGSPPRRPRVIIPVAGEDHDVIDPPHPDERMESEDEFNKKLAVSLAKLNVQQGSLQSLSTGSAIDAHSTSQCPSPIKKIPPPPPPRRVSSAGPNGPPPPLPSRKIVPSRTHSSSVLHSLGPPAMDRRAHSDTSSPFESQSELSFDAVAATKVTGMVGCMSCGCDDFVEDPFRGHGLCANCTHAHA